MINMKIKLILFVIVVLFSITGMKAQSASDKPNILVIMPDDVGWTNISAYGLGVMGYKTPNVDRIAKDGIMFTDHYAQPSCTAGRAAFITGQYPIRSGMTTVGRPGSSLGLKKESPTLAEVLKPLGYMCGQFGKNHLGDNNPHLPTNHGFDEFYGNLYHQNVSEEPENDDYPTNPEFAKKYGPRGVIHSWAIKSHDKTNDPRFGEVGYQRIEDTGPYNLERMKTIDYDFFDRSFQFMENSKKDGKPFFVWLNPSRQHMHIQLTDKARFLAKPYTTADDIGGSGLIDHDQMVGDLLDKMQKGGLLDNTIVIYTTDNGPEHSTMFHGGTTPFRGEKMTTYEGGIRVPTMVMWPGHIKPGQVLTGIQSHMDLFTTLAAAAGVKDVAAEIKNEKKQYIDGLNNLDYWLGTSTESKRNTFFYYYESDLVAARIGNWKLHFKTSEDYYDKYVTRKFPAYYNIRMDPFESYDSNDAWTWALQSKAFINEPLRVALAEHIKSMQSYPPVQKASTYDFSKVVGDLMDKLTENGH